MANLLPVLKNVPRWILVTQLLNGPTGPLSLVNIFNEKQIGLTISLL